MHLFQSEVMIALFFLKILVTVKISYSQEAEGGSQCQMPNVSWAQLVKGGSPPPLQLS